MQENKCEISLTPPLQHITQSHCQHFNVYFSSFFKYTFDCLLKAYFAAVTVHIIARQSFLGHIARLLTDPLTVRSSVSWLQNPGWWATSYGLGLLLWWRDKLGKKQELSLPPSAWKWLMPPLLTCHWLSRVIQLKRQLKSVVKLLNRYNDS